MAWNYQRVENEFTKIPEGDHRIRINEVSKEKSKTGRDMLKFQFDVNGYNSKLFHYIVFLPDRPEITNRNLTQFFDSFADIPDGNFNFMEWVGKVGAAEVEHDGEYVRIKRFIPKRKQASLPPWRESGNGSVSSGPSGFTEVDDDNMPF